MTADMLGLMFLSGYISEGKYMLHWVFMTEIMGSHAYIKIGMYVYMYEHKYVLR